MRWPLSRSKRFNSRYTPPVATTRAFGEMATAYNTPAGVSSPIRGRRVRRSLPVGSSQTLTVLSRDALTKKRLDGSVLICMIPAVCISGLMRRIGVESASISEGKHAMPDKEQAPIKPMQPASCCRIPCCPLCCPRRQAILHLCVVRTRQLFWHLDETREDAPLYSRSVLAFSY